MPKGNPSSIPFSPSILAPWILEVGFQGAASPIEFYRVAKVLPQGTKSMDLGLELGSPNSYPGARFIGR